MKCQTGKTGVMPDSGQHKNKKAWSFVVDEQRNPLGEGVIDPGMHELERSGFLDAVWKK